MLTTPITAEAVLVDVADLLKQPVTSLDPMWLRLAEQGLNDGWTDVVELLMGRGFSLDQINGWDQRVSACRDQAVFRTILRGCGLGDFSLEAVKLLDRREYLKTAGVLMVAGSPVAPAAGQTAVGGISSGTSTAGTGAGCDQDVVMGCRISRKLRGW